MVAIGKTYEARNIAKARINVSSTTTWTKSDRAMRGVTSHKSLNADWSK